MNNLHIIREIAKEKGLSLKWIAEQSGITEQGLQKIIEKGRARVETLQNIAATLNIPLTKLLNQSGDNEDILNNLPKVYKVTRNLDDIAEIDFLKQQLREKSRMIELLEEEMARYKKLLNDK